MVCFELDDYIRDRQNPPLIKPYWRVTLSDGRYVYQDDYREGLEEPIAWRRLAKYVKSNDLTIVDMWLIYRDHAEQVKQTDPQGYYFSFAKGADWGGSSHDYYVLGILEFGRVICYWYKVPELVVYMEDQKSVEEAGEALIGGERI